MPVMSTSFVCDWHPSIPEESPHKHLRAITLEWRCRMAWRVELLGGGTPLLAIVATKTGQRTDANGFPFLWEAMAREEIRQDPSVLL